MVRLADGGALGERARRVLRRALALALVLTAGTSLSVYLFLSARNTEERILSARFERASRKVVAAVGPALSRITGDLDALAALLGSRVLERGGFQEISDQLIARREDAQSFEWIPAVPARPRAHDAAREPSHRLAATRGDERARGGGPASRRAGRSADGGLEPAREGPSSPGWQQERQAAFAKARVTGEMTAALGSVLRDGIEEPAVLVVAPVYRGSAPPRTAPARRARLGGLVLGTYRVGRVVERALWSAGAPDIEVRLYDETEPSAEALLYARPPRALGARTEPERAIEKGLHSADVLQLADRTWRIVCAPTPALVSSVRTWSPWVSLGAGLLLTLLLAGYALTLVERVERAWAHGQAMQRDKEELERHLVERRVADGARRSAEEELRRIALHDALTQLPNRVLLSERFEQILDAARRSERWVAAALLDLDRFKEINDSLGHDVGDELLRGVARRLAASTREHDVVGRLGGDEFLVVLGELSAPEAANAALDRLLAALREPMQLAGRTYQPSASVGVALYPRDGQTPEVLLKNADVALYGAKEAGRNCARWFRSDMAEVARSRLDTAAALRRALEERHFVLHYQPILDLGLGRVTSAEALLRWAKPQGELLPASAFLPIAEETGLVVPIGRWSLRQACRQAAAWAGCRPGVRMAFNVSARELAEDDFVAAVSAALDEGGLPPELLELELTEGALMRNPERTAERLAALRAVGVRIVLDDFGLGYSSLSRLRSLPIDGLKLERSFLREAADHAAGRALLEALFGLAQGLGMSVVAKGVETQEQLEVLRAAWAPGSGRVATGAQGFAVGEPMPAERLEQRLDARDAPVLVMYAGVR